jgi:hypothetical protein
MFALANAREAFSQNLSAGIFSMERGEFAAALKLFDKATAIDRTDLSPYVLRAKCHMLADPPAIKQALAEATKVVKMKPNDATGYIIAWNTLAKAKSYETAFKLIRIGMHMVLRKDPQRQYIEAIHDALMRKLPESVTSGNNWKRVRLHRDDDSSPTQSPKRNLGMFGQYKLPNELVHTIFAYLPLQYLGRGQHVCKAWSNYIQGDTMLWSKVHLCGSHINNSVMEMVAKRSRSQLRSFSLSSTKVTTAGIRKIIATRPKQLLDVILARCPHIDHSVIADICKVFGKTLTRLSLIMQNLTDQSLNIIFTRCNQLVRLDVTGNNKITDAGFKSWPASSPLKSLSAVLCKSLSGHAWSTEYPNLIELDMSSTLFDLRSFGKLTVFPALQMLFLVDVNLNPIATIGSDIQLTLPTAAKVITSTTLVKLTHFAMTQNSVLDDETLETIALANLNLTHVFLTCSISLTDVGVSSLQCCKELKNLILNTVVKITDVSLKAILSACSKLEWLSVNDCPGVTDVSLDAIVDKGENLVRLHVSNCNGITGYGILKLHKKAGRPLKELIMNCLATVSNDTIRSFQQKGVYVEGNMRPVKIKVPGYK